MLQLLRLYAQYDLELHQAPGDDRAGPPTTLRSDCYIASKSLRINTR
jgi:hypothetical protein